MGNRAGGEPAFACSALGFGPLIHRLLRGSLWTWMK